VTSETRNSTAGFTLIELLVVVSIIVIVSAASIPMGLNFVRHYKVMGAAQGVAGQMQSARGQAVKLNTQRGVLLNFNYPGPGDYQWTSLDPNPMTGDWDDPVYPSYAPRNYVEGVAVYGAVPNLGDNTKDPDIANGVMSPHGTPIGLGQDLEFDPGGFNALLFRADGSVRAVTALGPSGAGVLVANGLTWEMTVRDPNTQLSKLISISRNGRVIIQE
jgi:prepilin-type N-terminal cleavage/methylation domain-containing protein